MAKKKEEVKKISEFQLSRLKELFEVGKATMLEIGAAEAAKFDNLNKLKGIESEVSGIKRQIAEEFGDCKIDFETGIVTNEKEEDV